MSVVGSIKEFNSQVEKFSTYYERVELYFMANGIAANKQVPVFLTVIGSKTYALLEDYLAPAKPKSKTLQELKDVLLNHFEPEPLLIAERFHFHKRNQKGQESIMEYVAELRKLATRCKFGDYIYDALRDHFVCGLRKENIQSQLLKEKTLTFATAIEMALRVLRQIVVLYRLVVLCLIMFQLIILNIGSQIMPVVLIVVGTITLPKDANLNRQVVIFAHAKDT
jgi:hypothetical protein